jgi:transcriptional regulator with XRE-family HTH domain
LRPRRSGTTSPAVPLCVEQSANISVNVKADKVTGAELKQKREARGWSQRELARRAELHHGAVQYWERQEVLSIRGYAFRRMAEALGWRINAPIPRARHGVLSVGEQDDLLTLALTFLPRRLAYRVAAFRVTCGAKTRKGTPCRAKSEPGRRRCRFHGGLSTGPKTAEGRARIAEAQHKRWAAWRSS